MASINGTSECVSELARGEVPDEAARRGQGILKPSRWKSQSPTSLQAMRHDPRAAMRNVVWGWLNKVQQRRQRRRRRRSSDGAEAQGWKPDGEAGPQCLREVKQIQWLKHITWLHWSAERERGSFTARTELNFTVRMQRCLKPECYRYHQESSAVLFSSNRVADGWKTKVLKLPVCQQSTLLIQCEKFWGKHSATKVAWGDSVSAEDWANVQIRP